MNTVLERTTEARNNLASARDIMLSSYLDWIEEVNSSPYLNLSEKVLILQTGRRSGATTWVKSCLSKYSDSLVIIPDKQHLIEYKNYPEQTIVYNSFSNINSLIGLSFHNKIVFIDVCTYSTLNSLESYLTFSKGVIITYLRKE